jgi:endogenous inhibitor of DNA gyrase (YacG/DUF329 family)
MPVQISPTAQLPADIAVLCPTCRQPVPLVLFLSSHGAIRRVRCPHCSDDVTLRDAW